MKTAPAALPVTTQAGRIHLPRGTLHAEITSLAGSPGLEIESH